MIQPLARRLLRLPARRCASHLEREWIPASDGVRLATLHFWPVGLRNAPALVTRTAVDASARPNMALMRLLSESGYHVICQDVRGRYQSEGKFEPFANEIEDGAATLGWLREQSWCRGPIGLFGASYSAYTAWAALAGAPQGVAAIAAAIGARDLYPSFHPGGAFALSTALEWATRLGEEASIHPRRIDLERGLGHRPTREADRVALRQIDPYRAWIDHPRRDAFWESILPALPETPPASLLLAGWYDFFLGPQLSEYAELERLCHERGLPAPELVVGPWTHGGLASRAWRRRNGLLSVALDHMLGFFARTLAEGAEAPEKPVQYFCAGRGWQTAERWPPPGQIHELFLTSQGGANSASGDGVLQTSQPEGEHRDDAFEHDPEWPVPSLGGAQFGRAAGVADQADAESRTDVLCYTTAPLKAELEIVGPVRLILYISADAPDADFTAKLVDVTPGGATANVCEGVQRARWREAGDTPSWLEPGEIVALEVDLWSAAWCFAAGHRVRLEISGSNFPRFDRSPGTREAAATATPETARCVVQHVHHGPGEASRLVLQRVSKS